MGRDLPLGGASNALAEIESILATSEPIVEAIGAGDEIKAVSMGCVVDYAPCSVCGQAFDHVHFEPLMARDVPGVFYEVSPSPQFLYATTVPAPRCDSCGAPMGVHEDKDWVCVTSGCQAEGFVVSAHLYQVFPAKLSP